MELETNRYFGGNYQYYEIEQLEQLEKAIMIVTFSKRYELYFLPLLVFFSV